MAALKSLERMFLGLEKKEIITGELARKVHELKDTEEFLNDNKAHQACAARKKTATVEEETAKGTLLRCKSITSFSQRISSDP
uniref:Uncharacterized protein n=1 Tax=Nelumbo nucifera TaxID=4432 RepID=A0A822YQM2_NELNU|nr:TPA_asm: hypothetical protein HUJ06_012510 [Nelumbo nucifera]